MISRRFPPLVLAGLITLSFLGACSSSGISGSPAPTDLQLPVAFGLMRNQTGLAQEVQSRNTPGSANFLSWITPAEIATNYGASPANVAAALATLNAAGFQGALDPTGGILIGTMSVGDAEAFFGTSIVESPLTGGDSVVTPSKPVTPPDSIASVVSDVAGLTFLVPTTAPASSAPAASAADAPCPTTHDLAATLAQVYGLSTIQAGGATGKGVRIAMLEVAPTSQAALTLARSCYGHPIAPVTVNMVDDSSASVFGDVAQESTLDIISASLMAPGLDGIDIYQFNPFSPVVFPFAAALADTYSPGGPQIISTSVGFCESSIPDQTISINEWLLMSAGATGVTVLASAGDSGSSACAPTDTSAATQYPASSPNVMAIGGTQFTTPGDPAAGQQVWNSTPTANYAGGGSASSRLPQPAYQTDLGIKGGRIVPDIAYLSSPSDFGQVPVCTTSGSCQFATVGGTSATAPGLAGGFASVLQYLGTDSPQRLGQPNWALYAAKTAGNGSLASMDITVGSNDLYGVGCCTAAVGFDAASGWGIVQFGGIGDYYRSVIAGSSG